MFQAKTLTCPISNRYLVPERKVMFRQNPNIEIRNPKQIRISNDKMTKTNLLELRYLCHWNILILVIVSYFVVGASFTSCRISNFLTKIEGFVQALYMFK